MIVSFVRGGFDKRVTQILSVTIMNLATPKAEAKLEFCSTNLPQKFKYHKQHKASDQLRPRLFIVRLDIYLFVNKALLGGSPQNFMST
jgi:hypothetical protein